MIYDLYKLYLDIQETLGLRGYIWCSKAECARYYVKDKSLHFQYFCPTHLKKYRETTQNVSLLQSPIAKKLEILQSYIERRSSLILTHHVISYIDEICDVCNNKIIDFRGIKKCRCLTTWN